MGRSPEGPAATKASKLAPPSHQPSLRQCTFSPRRHPPTKKFGLLVASRRVVLSERDCPKAKTPRPYSISTSWSETTEPPPLLQNLKINARLQPTLNAEDPAKSERTRRRGCRGENVHCLSEGEGRKGASLEDFAATDSSPRPHQKIRSNASRQRGCSKPRQVWNRGSMRTLRGML